MLRCIGAGLFICTLGFILLSALGVVGVIVSDDVQRYLSCIALAPNATNPGDHMEWYWKLNPSILYGIGRTIITVLLFEFSIAQSPDKMKGLVIMNYISLLWLCLSFDYQVFKTNVHSLL